MRTLLRAGKMARALCLVCLALLLLAQDVHCRKLSLREKQEGHGHGDGVATATISQEPYGEKWGRTGASNNGQVQFDSAKWAEIHTDYIYTQDVKNP